ncbi:MAG: hypothetical protein AAGF60_12430 [Pseudomonadota bacterium]
MRRLLAPLLICAAPAAAEPMDGAAFEAYTTGRTMFYGSGGQAYGAEEYFENRRVRWSFLDGECKDGTWYENGPMICFVYEDETDPQCWTFTRGAAGLIARFEGRGDAIYEAQDLGEEMVCLGPKVGV